MFVKILMTERHFTGDIFPYNCPCAHHTEHYNGNYSLNCSETKLFHSLHQASAENTIRL